VANRFLVLLGAVVFMSGCASGTFKARQEQREKIASSAGLYCEFVSGDLFPDLDVELNMRMAKRCDADRNFTITNYKNSSDQTGVMYCCSMAGGGYISKRQARAEKPEVVIKSAPAAAAPAPAATPAPAKAATPNAQPSQKEIEEAIIGE